MSNAKHSTTETTVDKATYLVVPTGAYRTQANLLALNPVEEH